MKMKNMTALMMNGQKWKMLLDALHAIAELINGQKNAANIFRSLIVYANV